MNRPKIPTMKNFTIANLELLSLRKVILEFRA